MTLAEEIQSAIKSKKAIIGYRESIKFIKTEMPKMVVIANNLPDSMRKEIEHNTKLSKAKLENFSGSSKDLGTICGVPYPVTTVTIKG